MTPHRPCVVGFGELVWDVLPHATLPGGAPANFVWHAQQLGAEGVIVSAVGDDQAGRDLLAWIESMGMDAGQIQTNPKSTGRVDVQVSAAGEPGYVISDPSAWDHIRWTESLASFARRADCVCFGSLGQRSLITRGTLYQFLATTSPDCLRVFDVNLRNPAPGPVVIEQSLAFANVLKCNEDEWPFVASRLGLSRDWSVGCRSLIRESKVRLVALTRGARGSVLLSDEGMLELPAEAIKITDTIGAGDAFCAALAVGLLRHAPLADVQMAAAKVAAFVCTREGATPRLPEHLQKMLDAPPKSVRLNGLRLRSPGTAVVHPHGKRTLNGEPAESH